MVTAEPMPWEAPAGAAPAKAADDLAALFQQYRIRIFHFALQMLGNTEDAMDVTQDAFLRLHRHWHRRDANRSAVAWLYAIARNLAIDVIRARRVRKPAAVEEADAEPSPAPGPEVLAGRSELRERIWAALAELPPALREVVVLRDLHGLSYAELAQTLGVPATTVTSRLHDARERLRKKLERYL